MKAPILVVEHDEQIGAALVEQLCADSYRVHVARTVQHARVLARAAPPGLAILGGLERASSALELLAEIRRGECRPGQGVDRAARESTAGQAQRIPPLDQAITCWPARLPVIVVCSHSREPDLLRAFDAGADDFLPRPARYLELRARLRALLARAEWRREEEQAAPIALGALNIDPRARAVTLHGHTLYLRRLEYELLYVLARDPRRVFAKPELMRLIWGYQTSGSTRTLDSHASRLRRRLCAASAERWVINVHGVGYRLI